MARAAGGKPSTKKATKASKASDKKAAVDKEVKKEVTVIRIHANSGIELKMEEKIEDLGEKWTGGSKCNSNLFTSYLLNVVKVDIDDIDFEFSEVVKRSERKGWDEQGEVRVNHLPPQVHHVQGRRVDSVGQGEGR